MVYTHYFEDGDNANLDLLLACRQLQQETEMLAFTSTGFVMLLNDTLQPTLEALTTRITHLPLRKQHAIRSIVFPEPLRSFSVYDLDLSLVLYTLQKAGLNIQQVSQPIYKNEMGFNDPMDHFGFVLPTNTKTSPAGHRIYAMPPSHSGLWHLAIYLRFFAFPNLKQWRLSGWESSAHNPGIRRQWMLTVTRQKFDSKSKQQFESTPPWSGAIDAGQLVPPAAEETLMLRKADVHDEVLVQVKLGRANHCVFDETLFPSTYNRAHLKSDALKLLQK